MKQEPNFSLILNKVLKLIPVCLAFLVPIFYLTTTTEFFAFNKLALITLATVLLVVLWTVKIMTGQKMEFIKSVIDLPLIAFTLVVVLSTIFSLNKTLSIYGSEGSWMGLFALLILIGYFYLATPLLSDLKTIKLAIYAFTASTFISTLMSLLSYYKIFVGNADYMKVQGFSLSGSTTDSAMLAAIAIVLSLGFLTYEKLPQIKSVLIGNIVVSLFFLMLVNVWAAWAILIVGVIAFVLYADMREIVNQRFYYTILAGLTVAVVLLLILPATRSVIISKSYTQEVNLPVTESWLVASSIVQNYPLMATGPATFLLNFTRYRPLSLNTGPYWNVRFDKPSNEFFNVLSTLGLLGLIAMLFFVAKVVKLTKVSKYVTDDNGTTVILSSVVLGILASFLFTYASITTAFMFFSFLGMLVAGFTTTTGHIKVSEKMELGTENIAAVTSLGDTSAIGKNYVRYIVAIPALFLAAYVSYFFFMTYEGEFYMRKAIIAAKNNDGSGTYEFQRRAINANPRQDVYQNSYAQTNLALANVLASKQNLTDADKTTIQGLLSQAIKTTQVTTEVLNPLSADNWETRAVIYRSLTNVANNASDWSISAYNNAIQLDPTNARLRLDLGGLYFAKADYLSAANQFRQATVLKADYANAYYNFAQALLKLNDPANAVKALQMAQSLVPANSDDYKKVAAEIAAIPAQGTTGTTADGKKTVEQITGNNVKTTAQNQEPLNSAAQGQQIPVQNLGTSSLPKDQQVAQPTPTPTPVPTTKKK